MRCFSSLPRHPDRFARHGFTLVYTAVSMFTLLLISTLAVDFGRVQMAKNELRNATDAAARYAATGIADGSYFTKASACAAQNLVDDSPLILQSGDVIVGKWSNNVFTPGGTPNNAVEVSTQRSVARGTAIPLLLGFTAASCNVTATSYATYTATTGGTYGIVGINSVTLQNNTITTDSYNSAVAAYGAASSGTNGGIASNGNFNLSGNVTISTDLYMQSGASITQNGSVNYGSKIDLSSPLNYTVTSAGTYSTNNENSNLSPYLQSGNFNFNNGTLHVPAGSYYMNTFSMNGGTLDIDGPATFYVNGDFTVQGGTVNVYNNIPANFTVNVVTAAGANFTNCSSLYINLYCPSSPININNCGNLYGSFIGSSLSVSGSCGLHVDSALLSGSSSGASGGKIEIVQ